MPLEPGVTIHADAMASQFGQKMKKTKQQKRKPQTNPTASEHPGSTLPGPIFFFGPMGRFSLGVAVCRSRLKTAP